jgi:ABC-type transport system substrate-binding protein
MRRRQSGEAVGGFAGYERKETAMNRQQILGKRLSRRRVVGGAASGAALITGGLATGCATPAPAPTAAAVAPAATAASGAAGPAAAAAPATPQPKYGGTVRYNVTGEAPHLDPHLTATTILLGLGPGSALGRVLFYKFGSDVPDSAFIPAGDLAESWTQADDLTYVIKLRQGAKWQNIAPMSGREVVAEDIVFSWQRQVDTKTRASQLPSLAKIEAVDKYTVKLTSPAPDADFLVTLAGPQNAIVPKDVVEQKGDLKDGPLIGFGPWILEKWTPNTNSTFKRNPDYYLKGLPYADSMEITRIADDGAALAAFRAHQYVMTPSGVTLPQLEQIKRDAPDLQIIRSKRSGVGLEFILNASMPPFNDIRVREAVHRAINRKDIIDTVRFGLGWYSAGIGLPDLSWALPEDEVKELTKQDIPRAKQLLAQAGFPNGFEFEFLAHNLTTQPKDTAELVAAQLRQVGITANIRLIDSVALTDRVRGRGEFQAVTSLVSVVIPWASLYTRLHSKGSQNAVRLNDPNLDQMIEKQNTLVKDPEARKKALMDLQRYVIKTYASSFLITDDAVLGIWFDTKNVMKATVVGDLGYMAYVWYDK